MKTVKRSKLSYPQLRVLNRIFPTGLRIEEDSFWVGQGYQASLRAIEYPPYLDDLTFLHLFSDRRIKVTLDLKPISKESASMDISRSIDELVSREYFASRASSDLTDQYDYQDLRQLHESITRGTDILSEVVLRIYVSALDKDELRRKLLDTQKLLQQEYGLTTVIERFEQLKAYQQLIGSTDVMGDPLPVYSTLARQWPFQQQHHQDPHGHYFGDTVTGKVILDPFRVIGTRLTGDMLIIGNKGSGKSTTIKDMMMQQIVSGNQVFSIDLAGEQGKLCRFLGGLHLRLGRDDIAMNPLEISSSADDLDTARNFNMSILKVKSFYSQYYPDAGDRELGELENFYIEALTEKGITEQTDPSDLLPEDYPLISDLLNLLRETLYEDYATFGKARMNRGIAGHRSERLDILESRLEQLTKGLPGRLYNRPSNFQYDPYRYIVFDVSELNNQDETVVNSMLFQFLSQIWQAVFRNRDHNRNVTTEIERRHIIAVIDEAHRFLKGENHLALEFILQMLRQARKYDAALWFATQSIDEFVGDELSRSQETIFNLTQYKVVMQQDIAAAEKIHAVLPQLTLSEIRQSAHFQKGESILTIGATQKFRTRRSIPEGYLEIFDGGR